jgi:hypothetical protein
MISLTKRIEAFVKLGDYLSGIVLDSATYDSEISHLAMQMHAKNQWFVEDFVRKALQQWSVRLLTTGELVAKYPKLLSSDQSKHVLVVPDDKVPFSGVSDLVSVLVSGNHFHCKKNNDQTLDLQYITNKLTEIEPLFVEYIHWDDTALKADTFLVQTRSGNDNAFVSYFKARRSLIRIKPVSVAIIAENDGVDAFQQLGDDIFTFFGLSPYNVRKLFVPRSFQIQTFLDSLQQYSFIYQYNRYANNYDYHQSVCLLEQIPFFDNGFMVFRETFELQAPIGCLFYEYYESIDELKQKLQAISGDVQQIVTNMKGIQGSVRVGAAHSYNLWDYVDRKDTLGFLLEN